jgi:hypothetical protein
VKQRQRNRGRKVVSFVDIVKDVLNNKTEWQCSQKEMAVEAALQSLHCRESSMHSTTAATSGDKNGSVSCLACRHVSPPNIDFRI